MGLNCGLDIDKPKLFLQPVLFIFRAGIESLMTREKFGISERKVHFIAMMGS